MLIYSYDIRLVLASIAISMMAAFTGLALTRGISGLPEGLRQLRIAMAAIALGGGIWSMHFVAILAMRFPVAVYYDALTTLASALIAILLAGLALLLMHFGHRGPRKVMAAGAILGAGIVAMHYVGLSGIEGCLPIYDPMGFVVAGALAPVMGIAAIRVAYGQRTGRNTVMATLILGSSVVVVHFSAMYWTDFAATADQALFGHVMGNSTIALAVLISTFVISGAFLLSGASFLSAAPAAAKQEPAQDGAQNEEVPTAPAAPGGVRVPYEREGSTFFLPAKAVAAIRAEGHYTIAYTAEGRVFCSWSISEAQKRLAPETGFLRVHRSYLVNTAHVTGFERRKDSGQCLFETAGQLERVPVSRARIAELRAALGL
ncbi:MAG: MHYT domain-containing protein [Paracoccaceae bacterium]